jgi:hypothetical protein
VVCQEVKSFSFLLAEVRKREREKMRVKKEQESSFSHLFLPLSSQYRNFSGFFCVVVNLEVKNTNLDRSAKFSYRILSNPFSPRAFYLQKHNREKKKNNITAMQKK